MKIALLLASLSLFAGLSEVTLRVFFRHSLRLIRDDRSLLYRFDSTLGWFPTAHSSNVFTASREIQVVNNSEGFRAPEHRTNGLPGLLFLGDSFVWGYDVEAAERFTEKLQTRHPEWNIDNLGVSGYGTDQELLLLQQCYAAYKPRVVFLVYSAETDEDDNRSNARYGGYYKPFCIVAETNLEFHGVPVPRSERAFLADHPRLSHSYLVRLLARSWFKLSSPPILHNPKNPSCENIRVLQKYVQSQGAILLMGLTHGEPGIEDCLKHFRIPFIDLSTPLRYSTYGNHWTPEGHSFVCRKIEEFLQRGKYMDETR